MELDGVSDRRPIVSIIIPTTCETRRADGLRAAISSARAQGEGCEVIVVVNGGKRDEGLRRSLDAFQGVKIIDIEAGNVSVARYAGICASTGEFFCFLDDDDELLPQSASMRQSAFGDDIDVVVSNGYINSGHDVLNFDAEKFGAIGDDPVGNFLQRNWFASPAGMFRSRADIREVFRIADTYFEMTKLFFLLYEKKASFKFVCAPLYRVNASTESSASKSVAYAIAEAEVIKSLPMGRLSKAHRERLKDKYIISLNAASVRALRSGERVLAWRFHMRCIAGGGLRYIPYTARLILSSFVARPVQNSSASPFIKSR